MPRLRTYRSGDETTIVDLANRAYAAYGGHVVRTVDHWRWSVLDRPGVTAADIPILESDAEVMEGYAVLGPEGIVLEFCLEPGLAGRARAAAATHLLRALEERCRQRAFETITFELPGVDARVRRLLLREGYREEPVGSFTVNLIDLPAFVREILIVHRDRLPPGWRADFLLDVAPGHYPPHRKSRLAVSVGERIIVAADPPPGARHEIEIATDLSTITEIVFHKSSFREALASGSIRVEPAEAIEEGRILFDLLALRSPWYTPPADGR